MFIVQNFNNATDAIKLKTKLEKVGCNVRVHATWSRAIKDYIYTVKATL